MRLKVKWVLLVSACIVGMWLLVIFLLPAPSNLNGKGRGDHQEWRRRHQQSLGGDDIRETGEVEETDIIRQEKQKSPLGAELRGRRTSEQKEVEDIVDVQNDVERSEEGLEEEKKVPAGVEIDNIEGGNSHNGQSLPEDERGAQSEEPHPLELDLVPKRKLKTRSDYMAVWRTAGTWVTSSQIIPAGPGARELGDVLYAMAHAPITKADIGFRGTQLKARLMLDGGQTVVFKPKRYTRDHVIYGTPYAGYDRHNGEIAAFHLDRVLNFRRAPIVVGRTVSLKHEILPVASAALNDTFLEQNGNTCFYGKCYYCKPDDAACGEGDMMEGSLTLWLPPERKLKKWRHLWSRTYKEGKKAKWETDDQYCTGLMTRVPPDRHPLILHMADAAVFDYLIGNADRHMYETFEADGDRGMLLHMDNAKSFGNPYLDEGTILAPIYQCCRLRRTTWTTLQQYRDGRLSHVMRQVLSHDPVAPVLTSWHLEALDRRLNDIIDTVNGCFAKHGEGTVLLD